MARLLLKRTGERRAGSRLRSAERAGRRRKRGAGGGEFAEAHERRFCRRAKLEAEAEQSEEVKGGAAREGRDSGREVPGGETGVDASRTWGNPDRRARRLRKLKGGCGMKEGRKQERGTRPRGREKRRGGSSAGRGKPGAGRCATVMSLKSRETPWKGNHPPIAEEVARNAQAGHETDDEVGAGRPEPE